MVVSTSSSAPSIAVLGATGQQGGSVIDHLIASSKPYRIIAITRDPSSASSKALQDQGVQVAKGDFGNKEELKTAFKGVDYVFGVVLTIFGPNGYEEELAHGKNVIDAVKSSPSIKKFFWSSVQNISKGSGGKLNQVYFFDVTEELFEYGKEQGTPIVSIQPGQFMENLLDRGAPRKQEDGSYSFVTAIGPQPMPLIATQKDYGAFVVGALEKDIPVGTEVYAFSQLLSYNDIAKTWGKVTGQKASYKQIPIEQSVQFGGPIMREAATWFNEYGYFGSKDLEPSTHVPSAVTTWEEFVKAADWSKIIV